MAGAARACAWRLQQCCVSTPTSTMRAPRWHSCAGPKRPSSVQLRSIRVRHGNGDHLTWLGSERAASGAVAAPAAAAANRVVARMLRVWAPSQHATPPLLAVRLILAVSTRLAGPCAQVALLAGAKQRAELLPGKALTSSMLRVLRRLLRQRKVRLLCDSIAGVGQDQEAVPRQSVIRRRELLAATNKPKTLFVCVLFVPDDIHGLCG